MEFPKADWIKLRKKKKKIMIISNIAFPYETFYQLPKTAFEAPVIRV